MDFFLAFLIAITIVSILLYASLSAFIVRLKRIYEDVSIPVGRALIWYGISAFLMGTMALNNLFNPQFGMVMVALTFGTLLISQLHLVMTKQKSINYSIILIFLSSGIATIETYYRWILPGVPIITVVVLLFLLVSSLITALYLVRESPNPFTASILTVVILLIIASVTVMTLKLSYNPQFFIIQLAPVIVTAGVTGALLQPWRRIITYSVLFTAISVGGGIALAAYLTGDFVIWTFVTVATFATICTIFPMDFFIDQAAKTRSSTAFYISVCVAMIALLVITHANNYAIANSYINSWDPYILFVDWIFGIFGVSAFLLAAVSASFTANARHATKELLIGIGMTLITLGSPPVRFITLDNGVVLERWELDPLYLGIFALLIVAFVVFFRVAYQLIKMGSKGAAARFLLFMFATLGLGIVAMFADLIALEILLPTMTVAGVFLIFSSPRTLGRSEKG